MKDIMKALLVGLLATGGVYASCIGPICWDETGISFNAPVAQGAAMKLVAMSTGTMVATSPTSAGELIAITPGSGNVLARVCVSSGTGRGAYVTLQSTTVVANNGQPACQ